MSLAVRHNLDRLGGSLRRYIALSGKSPEEALSKQGGKFAYVLSRRLRGLSPAKGEVRRERLEALKSGEGVKVRPRVREAIKEKYHAATDIRSKKLQIVRGRKKAVGSIKRKGRRINLQALMIARELAVRESGRGFLATGSKFPRTLKVHHAAISKFGVQISQAALAGNGDGATLSFDWSRSQSELSGSAASGLSKPRATAVTALALRDTADDIGVYLQRKDEENLRKAGLK
jgi:hypothetical protein